MLKLNQVMYKYAYIPCNSKFIFYSLKKPKTLLNNWDTLGWCNSSIMMHYSEGNHYTTNFTRAPSNVLTNWNYTKP